ncbi:MAG: L-seryl-tRNA(Sec) selenium transferase [Gemmatimonadetes bacterium]|nr:L-seryl-tRNA(Sec) selenium transferase [Gemmatimonadota bacterium]
MTDPRRGLPSMDALLREPPVPGWIERFGRETVKASLARALAAARAERGMNGSGETSRLLASAEADLAARARSSLVTVLNGTGVVLHTNLGRAPLAEEAIRAQTRAAGYGNVELSLESGERGSRYDHCAALICELTGAEAAIVTNNNAAAVSLVVNELARDREVLVSRGELVEIGGSFRIPDVIARSGARLREVGTTNRTRATDYEAAIGGAVGLVLRVHPSNYRVEGFAARPTVADLATVAAGAGVPLAHDVGSGLLRPDLLPGFPEEPSVVGSLDAGADLVTWSGDKLLGGPQAGLIAGRAELVERLRRNPLLRAYRVDKTTLAALEATLMLYRDPDLAARRVPTLRMLRESADSVERRARAACPDVPPPFEIDVERTRSVVGGGSFPGFELESAAWVIRGGHAARLAHRARSAVRPLLGRIAEDAFAVDLRTIAPGDETATAEVLIASLADEEAAGG